LKIRTGDFDVRVHPIIRNIIVIGLLMSVLGCELPYPGPYKGRVTDSASGRAIVGAEVNAEWWCHDSPLPDGPGSFFINSSTITDENGYFLIDKETRRGGLFGSSFVLKVRKHGYIPMNLIAMRQGENLPASTQEYPFIKTISTHSYPEHLDIILDPAAPVLLRAMKSGKPFYQKIAREKLIELVGRDFKYDAKKWEKAVDSGISEKKTESKERLSSGDQACPCPNAADRSGQPKVLRKRIREFVNAGGGEDVEGLRRFLDEGIDPNSQNYACRTALMKAAYHGSLDAAKYLITRGADVNMRDDNCSTALIKAASQYNGSDMVKLLLDNGAFINAQDRTGMTALMTSAYWGYTDIVRILVDNGADITLVDDNEETAWFKAAAAGHDEVKRILESSGSDH
jgi:hypothetical protein